MGGLGVVQALQYTMTSISAKGGCRHGARVGRALTCLSCRHDRHCTVSNRHAHDIVVGIFACSAVRMPRLAGAHTL